MGYFGKVSSENLLNNIHSTSFAFLLTSVLSSMSKCSGATWKVCSPGRKPHPPSLPPTPSISLLWVMVRQFLQDLLEWFSALVIVIVRTGAERDPLPPFPTPAKPTVDGLVSSGCSGR